MIMTYREIMPGIRLRVIETSRFVKCCLSVNFISELTEDSAAAMTLIPRILRRGSEKHPDMESLAAVLDEMYGARIEPNSCGFGSVISGGFICDFTELEKKLLPEISSLLSEMLFSPKLCDGTFKSEYAEGECRNLKDEIKSEINNKLLYARRRASKYMYPESPFAISELGSEESVDRADVETLFKEYKNMIKKSPCEIFFCGNYSYEEVESAVKNMFAACPREKTASVRTQNPNYASDVRQTDCLDVAQANLILGLYSEETDAYVAKLLSSVIGGGTSSKLFVNVREKESLCYFAGSIYDSFAKSMIMYCGIAPENSKIAEAALLREFEKCKNGEISEEEISNAKKDITETYITVEDSVFSLESFWMRASMIGDERTPDEVVSAINKIDISELSDAAKSFKLSVTYLLTGKENGENARKLLS